MKWADKERAVRIPVLAIKIKRMVRSILGKNGHKYINFTMDYLGKLGKKVQNPTKPFLKLTTNLSSHDPGKALS